MTAYAAGDARAFEALYARHQASLYRFIRRLLGSALNAQTDEVFQDTWLRVVHARARWAPQGASFRTWLFTLAHHRVVDPLRRSGREVSVDAHADADGAPWQPEAGAAFLPGTRARRLARRGAAPCGRGHRDGALAVTLPVTDPARLQSLDAATR